MSATKLPPELLLSIFPHLCHKANLNDDLLRVSALAIASVCRLWRDVCLSEASLWSSIIFHAESAPDYAKTRNPILPILRLFLRRSGSKHLTVHATIPFAHDPCLYLLIDHSERWANVHLTLPRATLVSLTKLRLPSLQVLSIQLTSYWLKYAAPHTTVVDAFEDAPLLHSLTLLGNMPRLKIPFDQITKVTSDHPGHCEMPAFLLASRCTQLRTLTLTPYHNSFALYSSHHLTNLTLALTNHSSRSSFVALSFFTTPNLMSLRFTSSDHYKWFSWPHDLFIGFVKRSGLLFLRELTFDSVGAGISGDNLAECLSLLPSLELFTFIESSVGNTSLAGEVCRAFTRRWDPDNAVNFHYSPALCPNLTTLNLGFADLGVAGSIIAATEMVESRCVPRGKTLANQTSLIIPQVDWDNAFSNQLRSRLRVLENNGLQLYIR